MTTKKLKMHGYYNKLIKIYTCKIVENMHQFFFIQNIKENKKKRQNFLKFLKL